MQQLEINVENENIRLDLPDSDNVTRIQRLVKFELREGSKVFDTFYLQLELSKDEFNVPKEVMDRLAGREPPFTHIKVRKE